MKTAKHHKEGSSVMVEVWNPTLRRSEMLPGKVTGAMSALDRDYRVSVKLEDGREFTECAPECVTK